MFLMFLRKASFAHKGCLFLSKYSQNCNIVNKDTFKAAVCKCFYLEISVSKHSDGTLASNKANELPMKQ